MRPVRLEFLSALTVLGVAAALTSTFPYGAIRFAPRRDAPRKAPFASFVALSDAELSVVLRTAKTAWQGNAGDVRRLRVDMSLDSLPDDDARAALDIGVPPRPRPCAPIAFPPGPAPVSCAAPAPVPLPKAAADEASPAAFPREALLKLD